MTSSYRISLRFCVTTVLLLHTALTLQDRQASASELRFQRPGQARAQREQANQNFRSPDATTDEADLPEVKAEPAPSRQETRRKAPVQQKSAPSKSQAEVRQASLQSARPLPKPQPKHQVQPARHEREVIILEDELRPTERRRSGSGDIELTSYGCDICDGYCTCEPACGIAEPGCGIGEPGCGMVEPGCGMYEPSCGCGEPSCGICEPGCGMYEPGCGVAEPSCGCGDVGCGSCVGRPGPDYWCFPVCLPRFKDLSLWAGVQGFRGPRDFANNRSDSNFGFHEGFNVSGRAPLVGLLFPQLSYQLGYQAVQSRLHGTATSIDDRSQQFVTAGFFRRVNTGLQFGAVWDLMEDDLDSDIDLHQIRGEISLKSPQGREIGFLFTSSTNDATSLGTVWETVDQYLGFYRWTFGNGYESRLWGGATGDGEGIFGGEFYAPLNNRWAVGSGFNYLITDEADGLNGVSQESWNIGINLVWHLGRTAKRGCRSPYRPLFNVADNGWMFVDQAQ